MKPTRAIVTLFILIAGLSALIIRMASPPPAVHAQPPAACSQQGSATAAAAGKTISNLSLGCYQWRLTYTASGFSALSIQLESAPSTGSGPGAWTAFSSTVVTDGTNPATNTNAATIAVHSAAAYVRVNVTAATGTGTIAWQLYGANSTLPVIGSIGAAGATGNTGAAGATGNTGPLANAAGGSNFLWQGYPLTGVSFATSTATLSGNVMQTLFLNPSGSGKRVILQGFLVNTTGTATTYNEFLSNGTFNMWLNGNLAIAVNASNALNYTPMLEPGESAVFLCPNSLTVSLVAMSFNLTDPLKSIVSFGALSTGSNLIYTVPAGTTAFFMVPKLQPTAFSNSIPFIYIYNFDTVVSTSYTVFMNGVASSAALGPYSGNTAPPGNGTTFPAFPALPAGATITISTSAGSSATGYYANVWERPN